MTAASPSSVQMARLLLSWSAITTEGTVPPARGNLANTDTTQSVEVALVEFTTHRVRDELGGRPRNTYQRGDGGLVDPLDRTGPVC